MTSCDIFCLNAPRFYFCSFFYSTKKSYYYIEQIWNNKTCAKGNVQKVTIFSVIYTLIQISYYRSLVIRAFYSQILINANFDHFEHLKSSIMCKKLVVVSDQKVYKYVFVFIYFLETAIFSVSDINHTVSM